MCSRRPASRRSSGRESESTDVRCIPKVTRQSVQSRNAPVLFMARPLQWVAAAGVDAWREVAPMSPRLGIAGAAGMSVATTACGESTSSPSTMLQLDLVGPDRFWINDTAAVNPGCHYGWTIRAPGQLSATAALMSGRILRSLDLAAVQWTRCTCGTTRPSCRCVVLPSSGLARSASRVHTALWVPGTCRRCGCA